MVYSSAVCFLSVVFAAKCTLIYDTELASKFNTAALSTAENEYLAITIDTKNGTQLVNGYIELLYVETNNRSDIQTLYYNPGDDTVRLESIHQLRGVGRKAWSLETRNNEKLILVVGSEWVKLVADCDPLDVFDAFEKEDLLSLLRSADLEITYPEEVSLELYNDEELAIDAQCSVIEQDLPEAEQ